MPNTNSWLEQAIEIHRARHLKNPDQSLTQRQLGIVLVLRAQTAQDDVGLEALTEGYGLLRNLYDRDVLEHQYRGLVEHLAQFFEQRE